jgi:urea transporter
MKFLLKVNFLSKIKKKFGLKIKLFLDTYLKGIAQIMLQANKDRFIVPGGIFIASFTMGIATVVAVYPAHLPQSF